MTDATSIPTTLGEGTETTPINSQIQATLKTLFENASGDAKAQASEAEVQAKTVADSLALQDAVAHLRRMQILSETAFSLAVSTQAKGDIAAGEAIMKCAQDALNTARAMLQEANTPAK